MRLMTSSHRRARLIRKLLELGDAHFPIRENGSDLQFTPCGAVPRERATYVVSWFRYDPAREIARLNMPVLILQGTTDIQVSVADAKLLAKANPAAKLVVIEGMNHVLKEVPAARDKQLAPYGDPSPPLARGLVSEIAFCD
jgi:fermentation-respiration switch protein FrsA (DUF1100 family)